MSLLCCSFSSLRSGSATCEDQRVRLVRCIKGHREKQGELVEILPGKACDPANTYTGQMKVALVDVKTHDNPIRLEPYTMRQGKVWAVICDTGKPFIHIYVHIWYPPKKIYLFHAVHMFVNYKTKYIQTKSYPAPTPALTSGDEYESYEEN